MITDEGKVNYKESDGIRCPSCDSYYSCVQEGEAYRSKELFVIPMVCDACHVQWDDLFTLTDIQVYHPDDTLPVDNE